MNKVQKAFIKEALEYDYRLNGWEYEFINNLASKDDAYELSEKQNHILNKIHDKIY